MHVCAPCACMHAVPEQDKRRSLGPGVKDRPGLSLPPPQVLSRAACAFHCGAISPAPPTSCLFRSNPACTIPVLTLFLRFV